LARICRSEPQIVASDRTQLHSWPTAKITNVRHFRTHGGPVCQEAVLAWPGDLVPLGWVGLLCWLSS
jgi:hypothetical protein